MATAGVGDDIEDVCSRCGEGWHVVMAKLGERIAKVVCKRCGSQHNYRASDTTPAPAAAASATTATGGAPRRIVRRRAARVAAAAPVTPPPPFDPSVPPRGYSAKDSYRPGERIDHPAFGMGVVAGSPGPGKVDVAFPTGQRTLACAREGDLLSRPETGQQTVQYADRPPAKASGG
jgi:ribosomal protein S27AE